MRHHERSVFEKIENRWYFKEGEMMKPKQVRREAPKVGRNDPCPCGSGKKYKKCCCA
jgi:SEC-C motif-containing protein